MNSQISGGMSWSIAAYLKQRLGGSGVGWAFMLRDATDELVSVCDGWARAPWEASSPAVPVTPTTRMMIASMSKQITNFAVRAMVDDWNLTLASPTVRPGVNAAMIERVRANGQPISLDTYVYQLIDPSLVPTWGNGTKAITLRDVMMHESGIDLTQVPSATWADGGDTDALNLWGGIAATFALDTTWTPGSSAAYAYNNNNYIILRAILENNVKQSYEPYCQQRLWAIVNATGASCHNSDSPRTLYYPRIVSLPGIDRSGTPTAGANWPDYAARAGAFGWYVSIRDLTTLLLAVRQGKVLTPASTAALFQNHDGLMTFNAGTSTGVGHNGGWGIDGGSFGGCGASFDNDMAAALYINGDAAVDATELFQDTIARCVPRLLIDQDSKGYVAPSVDVRNPFGYGDVHVTLDGSIPTSNFTRTILPIVVRNNPATVTAMLFDGATPVSFAAQTPPLSPPNLRPALPATPTSAPGLSWRLMPTGGVDHVPGFYNTPSAITASGTGVPDATLGGLTQNYALEFRGYLIAPADGVYSFTLASDDGSLLYVGDDLVVNSDGAHGAIGAPGAIGLKAGAHPFVLTYFQNGGAASLSVYWTGPNVSRAMALADFLADDGFLPAAIDATPGDHGVAWRLAETNGARVVTFDSTVDVRAQGRATSISLDVVQSDFHYALEFTALLKVPADGSYTFHLSSDDGSRLFIGPVLVVDNDGAHGDVNVDGTIGLRKGHHRLRVLFIQIGGGQALTLQWTRPGATAPEALDSFLSMIG